MICLREWRSFLRNFERSVAMKRSWNWLAVDRRTAGFRGSGELPADFCSHTRAARFSVGEPAAYRDWVGADRSGTDARLPAAGATSRQIFGTVLAVLSLGVSGLFLYGIFVGAKHVLPASPGAPQVGQTAPDFTLPDSQNRPVSLTGALNSPFAPESGTASRRARRKRPA